MAGQDGQMDEQMTRARQEAIASQRVYHETLERHFRGLATHREVLAARVPLMVAASRLVDLKVQHWRRGET